MIASVHSMYNLPDLINTDDRGAPGKAFHNLNHRPLFFNAFIIKPDFPFRRIRRRGQQGLETLPYYTQRLIVFQQGFIDLRQPLDDFHIARKPLPHLYEGPHHLKAKR